LGYYAVLQLPCWCDCAKLLLLLLLLLLYGFIAQTAEYLLDKGLLDLVVPRSFLKGALFEIIDFYKVWVRVCVCVLAVLPQMEGASTVSTARTSESNRQQQCVKRQGSGRGAGEQHPPSASHTVYGSCTCSP
jgi:hypothetical protein